jgi:hypothetical protein
MAKQSTTPETTAQLRRELGYLSDSELAAFLGIGVPRLKNRRIAGDAPPSSKVGNENLTAIKDALTWVARRKRAAA